MTSPKPRVRIEHDVATLAAGLLADVPVLADRAFRAIVTEDAGYAAMDPARQREVREHNELNLRGLLATLAGTEPIRTDVPRETARRRAAQGVPLGTVLHAYRIGFRVLWEGLVERAAGEQALPADRLASSVSAVWWMIDIYSEAVTDAYRETLVDLAREDERRRLVLLDALIEGRGGDWTTLGGSGQSLGLPEHGPYLCVNADPGDVTPERALRRYGVRSVWRLRVDAMIGVVSVPAHNDPGQILAILDEGAVGRTGVSPPFEDLRDVATAVRFAGTARSGLRLGTSGATTITADPIAALVAGNPGLGALIAESVLGSVLARPDRELLLDTLEAHLSGDGSISGTAARLYCHRNTVRNRLAKIEECTGRSLARPQDAGTLYAAICAQRLSR
jgi:hypothetical protein